MKALIWDLDGTLVDSYRLIVNHLIDLFSPFEVIKYKETYKAVTQSSVRDYVQAMCTKHEIQLEEIIEQYNKLNEASTPDEYLLMPNTKTVLEHFSQLGFVHLIYTHRGLSTYDILTANEANHYFEDVITSDNGFKRKPDPDALLHLIETHHVNLHESYYIGDRLLDIECGNRAGLNTAFVDSNALGGIKANVVVNELIELLDHIK